MGDIGKTALQCQTVLYAQHDALAPPPFVGIQLSGRTGNTYMVGIGGSDTLYLIEYQIRIGFRRDAVCVLFPAIDFAVVYLIGKTLPRLGLWQISHHRHGIQLALRHLVEVYQHPGVSPLKMDALGEEHRRIAMGVECQYLAMQLLGLGKFPGPLQQPAEKGLSIFP